MNGLQRFVKKNSSTILTCVGAAGVVGTSILTAKGTIKASKLLEEAKAEKGEELTKKETVRVAAPAYIPAVMLGASTIACIFGANILNKRSQAAITSAYALLDQSFKDYKKKAGELYGDEANDNIRAEIAKDKYEESDVKVTDENNKLFYDEYSGRYFELSTEQLLHAEYEINRTVSEGFGASLNCFYRMVGLPETDYGEYLGWEGGQLYEHNWSDWVHFYHQKVVLDDGLECTIISFTDPMVDNDEY